MTLTMEGRRVMRACRAAKKRERVAARTRSEQRALEGAQLIAIAERIACSLETLVEIETQRSARERAKTKAAEAREQRFAAREARLTAKEKRLTRDA